MRIKAEMGHWSSVVGGGVHLIADDGRMVGQLMFCCHTDDLREKAVQMRLARICCDAINAPPAMEDGAADTGTLGKKCGGPGSEGTVDIAPEGGGRMTISVIGTRTRRTLIERARVAGESEGSTSTEPKAERHVAQMVANDMAVMTAEQDLAADILAELNRARAKFPGKNVTFAALVEEVGELATATFEESAHHVRKEAVQVAVMAMRMVLDGDHVYDAWRAKKGLDHLDPAKRAAVPSSGEGEP